MPTSRWLTMDFWCSWVNSMGSSMVRMWPRLCAVAVVDHGRQGAGLTRAGGPDHQQESPLDADEFRQHGRQGEFLEGRNAVLDIADHHRRSAALAKDIDPEAPDTLQLHPQVALPGLGQFPLLTLVHHGVGQGHNLLAGQGPVAKGQEGPIHLQMRPRALAEEEVGAMLGGHDFEKGIQVHGHSNLGGAVGWNVQGSGGWRQAPWGWLGAAWVRQSRRRGARSPPPVRPRAGSLVATVPLAPCRPSRADPIRWAASSTPAKPTTGTPRRWAISRPRRSSISKKRLGICSANRMAEASRHPAAAPDGSTPLRYR